MATVNLSWTAPQTGGAPTSYVLYRTGTLTANAPTSMTAAEVKEADVGTDGSGTPTVTINPDSSTGVLPTSHSDSDSVSSGYTYFYTIAGTNSGGEGDLSNVATAVVT